jgi:N-acetylneuraminate synthase
MEELGQLSKASKAFQTMRENPVDKDLLAESLLSTKSLFSKSLTLRESLQAGTILKKEMFTLKKPGTGIAPGEMENLTGRRLIRDVAGNRLLSWDDIE